MLEALCDLRPPRGRGSASDLQWITPVWVYLKDVPPGSVQSLQETVPLPTAAEIQNPGGQEPGPVPSKLLQGAGAAGRTRGGNQPDDHVKEQPPKAVSVPQNGLGEEHAWSPINAN